MAAALPKGSPGAEIIPEARALTRFVIPNQAASALPENLDTYQQVVLEKNTLDVFDNPNTDALLALITRTGKRRFDPEPEFVISGVVTEYCVRFTVEGLLRRGRRVAIVTDAIQPLDAFNGRKVLEELKSRGARLITTAEALARVIPFALSA